jgi:hypothetical protein
MERRGKRCPLADQWQTLVHEYHQAGHFGRDAVYNKLYADGYWWPKMRQMINEELANCDSCIRFVVTKSGYHPAGSITALLPGDHWQMDCTSHMPESEAGHTAMLVVVDVCTGMVLLLKPMKNITAKRRSKIIEIDHVYWSSKDFTV